MADVAGIVLTGGSSRRMGVDKATLLHGDLPAAERIARLLRTIAAPVCEVGSGCSGLPTVRERPPGGGPLAAVAAGRAWLTAHGHLGACLVVACDLPRLDAPALAWLAEAPGSASVVPLVDDRPQWLCARWSAADLDRAVALVAAGERAIHRVFTSEPAQLIGPASWPDGLTVDGFRDADTPAELDRLVRGVHPDLGPTEP